MKDRDDFILKEKVMQESIDNYKNMQRVDSVKEVPKKRVKSKDLKKSKTKAPFDNVKSRLFQSIESSRQKSNQKYVNPDKSRFVSNKENNEDSRSKSIHLTNSKYGGPRSPTASESKSLMTSTKNNTYRAAYYNISENKNGILSNSGIK